jgi:hypothetical protein
MDKEVPMRSSIFRVVATVCFVGLTLGAPLRAALITPIYAIAKLAPVPGQANVFQFGVFDLGSPIGSPGSYQYAWTSRGGTDDDGNVVPSYAPLANLALNSVTSEMYLQYDFNEYRSVSTAGAIGASLGSMAPLWGMAFNNAGNLYGAHASTWYTLDPSTGVTISSTGISSVYSQFGGGLTYASDGNFYFSSPFPSPGELFEITAGGASTSVGTLSGTSYNAGDWMAMFSSGANTYLLNKDRLYQVNLSNASLSLMGTITGLPDTFEKGFSGAVGVASAPIPEPGTWAAAVLLAGGAALARWRRRRVS